MCIGNVEPHFKIQNIKPNEDEIFSRAVPYHKTWSEGEKKPQGRKLIGPIRFTSSPKINTKDSRKNHEFDIKTTLELRFVDQYGNDLTASMNELEVEKQNIQSKEEEKDEANVPVVKYVEENLRWIHNKQPKDTIQLEKKRKNHRTEEGRLKPKEY